jgi:hypothetical protein
MQGIRVLFAAGVLFLFLLSSAARAEELILEAEPGVSTLAYCDYMHNIRSCVSTHVETAVALRVGSTLELDGQVYVITWMGPGYYLENGAIVEPLGNPMAKLRGQRWTEVKPREGRVRVSHRWRDLDRNKVLSASDMLALDDGPAVKVKDVRLHVRVKSLPAKAE